MNINFVGARYFLTTVSFDFGVSYQEMINELKNEEWQKWSYNTPMGHENPTWDTRYRIVEIKSTILKTIARYVQSDTVKNKVLDALYSFNPAFEGLWSLTKDQMREWTSWHMEYMMDKPGFYLQPHNDFRRLVCAGMLYFNETNDPDVATTFYSDRSLNDELVMKNGYGTGWLGVNDYVNWHTGKNASNYNRYSALIALTIKPPEMYR
jgi:hypothetical protein